MSRLPSLFVSHGPPTTAVEPTRVHAGYDYGVLAMDAWRFDAG
jgi:aromatic ring-opening dioxygenase catalytic subunit (LigB family)